MLPGVAEAFWARAMADARARDLNPSRSAPAESCFRPCSCLNCCASPRVVIVSLSGGLLGSTEAPWPAEAITVESRARVTTSHTLFAAARRLPIELEPAPHASQAQQGPESLRLHRWPSSNGSFEHQLDLSDERSHGRLTTCSTCSGTRTVPR